ncbi:MAG: hypothetical protein KF704_02315 [Crocinitomicaceae bacterium]|nr:hypothetical protein [Crocinitomicaceae bacterium]
MEIILTNGNIESHIITDINNVTFSGQLIGQITSLDCSGATITGTLVEGVTTNGVSADIDYTGGNGGTHNGQVVTSTGVTGLTATLTAGSFSNGAGTLTYTITGTPSSSGTASFAINIGGMTCSLQISVNGGVVSTLDCAGATINGTLVEGVAASAVSAGIDYTGGNGGTHNGQVVTSTGVTGLTATLTAGSFSNGAGTLTYTITGTPSSSGTASFAINIGGMTCLLQITVSGGAVSALYCAAATITGTLVEGATASGVSADIDYTGGNGGTHNGQVVTSTGVTGLTATLTAGNFASGAGTLTYAISGTPSASGTASFAINIGGMTCSLQITVSGGAVSALDCAGATINGTLVEGVTASGVSADIDYTGGNGGTHNGQVVTSTGVTGLTATLTAGNFATGAGTLTYAITGTPSASGTASFAINIGGMTCSLQITVNTAGPPPSYPSGMVHCGGIPTAVVDVTNPTTGKTWMDRNLGASQVATSMTDANAKGDLYQWGRVGDGHQCRNSLTTSTISSTVQPGHNRFIIGAGWATTFDWHSVANPVLWDGVNGVNLPCPTGYRIPTIAEWDAERLSWSSNDDIGAFNSPLKLIRAGQRFYLNGSVNSNSFYYWSSTTYQNGTRTLNINGLSPGIAQITWDIYRAYGNSVRCIKD